MGLARISTRHLAEKKVNLADTFARILDNFIMMHRNLFYVNGSFFENFLF